MKRLLIFSHYNLQGLLSSYVVYTLEKFRPLFKRVVFVSNSRLDEEAKERLIPFSDKIIERENSGFDFGAWKQAINEEGLESIESFDELTLMNDTCFGPLYDFDIVIKEMGKKNVDFWGLTNHGRLENGYPDIKGPILEHIQSYYICFRKEVVKSSVFRKFWSELKNQKKVEKVIELYETKLTNLLVQAGFNYSVYVDLVYDNYSPAGLSPDINPHILIKSKIPFVKVKNILQFTIPSYLIQLIENNSEYDSKLIIDHFNQTYSPNVSKFISNKNFVQKGGREVKFVNTIKVAVHFHVFYVDVFEKHLTSLSVSKINFDLFITTDSNTKKNLILLILTKYEIKHKLRDIFVFENRGRDVLPWLTIAERLKQYHVVGHFHTKKTISSNEWVGASWMNELVATLIERMDEIIELFENEPCLGIVIPDIPVFYKKLYGVDFWFKTKTGFQDLWKKMKLKKSLDLDKIITPIMSYGTMFWYRTTALKPLFELQLSAIDFPEEPLPEDGSIAHAIESLPVYVAWDQGFDYKVVLNENYVFSGFDYSYAVEMKEKIRQISISKIWKVGLFVTWLPRKIYNLLGKK